MTVEEFSVEVIVLILSMTVNGSIISCFLFVLKPIIKDRLPKSFQYYMWVSVLIALLLPVSKIIAIPVPKASVLPMESMYDIVQRISGKTFEKTVSPGFSLQNGNGQIAPHMPYLQSMAVVLCIVWQIGMVLVLGFYIICYVIYLRRLDRHNTSADRQEIEMLNNLQSSLGINVLRLYKNPMVETPILIGFFHPVVILPDKHYEDTKLRNILMHEIAHRKRHDIFVKWLLISVESIHWFNPLVHFVRREMNRACELACDEAVIKGLDRNEMQQYGDTLIAVAADSIRKMPLPIAMFEDKKNLKERLGAIMKYKKQSKRTVLAASAILVMIVCTILGVSTLRSVESGHHYADNFSLEDQMYIREHELENILQEYDEENIVMAKVLLEHLDGDIMKAYISIMGHEKNPDSEMINGLTMLASEELELDISNIDLMYIDFESLTSREGGVE